MLGVLHSKCRIQYVEVHRIAMGSLVILGPPVPIRLLIESSIFILKATRHLALSLSLGVACPGHRHGGFSIKTVWECREYHAPGPVQAELQVLAERMTAPLGNSQSPELAKHSLTNMI